VNLADAIRQAATGTGFVSPPPTPGRSKAAGAAVKQAEAKREVVEAIRASSAAEADASSKGHDRDGHGTHVRDGRATLKLEENFNDLTVTSPQTTHTALPVKFELYLSPEQLTNLFKGVVATQHSVMTLRETARYLRIPGRKLEEMAQLAQIPAFLIDGKWRFARNNVDEWLKQQSFTKEMEA
jgi:excisionase family DNA binding protein